jgi:hypothetical protein
MQDYLMSGDEANREYGLYVMEKDSPYHEKDALLAYNFDSDTFFHVRDREKGLFIPLSELTCCKDEFGNEYRGKQLLARVKDAIKAYQEELPGYVEKVLNNPDFDFDD